MDNSLSPETRLRPLLLSSTESDKRLIVDDPAIEAAPLMRDLAHAHCPVDETTGRTCMWYHGYSLYQSLLAQRTPRMAGRRSLGWEPSHAVFFLDAFRLPARAGILGRALVTGSSDYMLPSLVIDACRRESTPVHMTLVDRCETPLRINQWYADRRGYVLETVRSDILDYQPAQPFDLLCTHNLLNFIAPDDRPALFRRWREALRRGGRLVLVNCLRPSAAARKIADYATTAPGQLAQAVADTEDRLLMQFPPHDEILLAMLERVGQKKFYPVRSRDDIAEGLRDAGFAIDRAVSLDSCSSVVPGWIRRANKQGTMGLIATAL